MQRHAIFEAKRLGSTMLNDMYNRMRRDGVFVTAYIRPTRTLLLANLVPTCKTCNDGCSTVLSTSSLLCVHLLSPHML